MELIVLLFVIGIALLSAEVFVPGGVLGVLGGVAMLGGCVLSFTHFGLGGGLIASCVAVALLGLVLWFEIRILPRTAMGRQLFVRSTVDSTSQPPVGDDSLLGVEGEAVTTLAPSGYVLVRGRRYEAFSDSGHLPRGAQVRVRSRDTFRLIVTKT